MGSGSPLGPGGDTFTTPDSAARFADVQHGARVGLAVSVSGPVLAVGVSVRTSCSGAQHWIRYAHEVGKPCDALVGRGLGVHWGLAVTRPQSRQLLGQLGSIQRELVRQSPRRAQAGQSGSASTQPSRAQSNQSSRIKRYEAANLRAAWWPGCGVGESGGGRSAGSPRREG